MNSKSYNNILITILFSIKILSIKKEINRKLNINLIINLNDYNYFFFNISNLLIIKR